MKTTKQKDSRKKPFADNRSTTGKQRELKQKIESKPARYGIILPERKKKYLDSESDSSSSSESELSESEKYTNKKKRTVREAFDTSEAFSSSEEEPVEVEFSESDDSGDDYEEKKPAAKRDRWVFPQRVRKAVLRTAPVNKDNFHVCPPCGRPLMSKDTEEEVIAVWDIKENKAKGRPAGFKEIKVSAQLDHNFPSGETWAQYYDRMKKQGKSDDFLKKAYSDEVNLRPMCFPCNVSHKYEGKPIDLSKDYSKEGYESDHEDRQEDVYKRIKKKHTLLSRKQLLTKYPKFKAAKKAKIRRKRQKRTQKYSWFITTVTRLVVSD